MIVPDPTALHPILILSPSSEESCPSSEPSASVVAAEAAGRRLAPAVFLDRDGVINQNRTDHVKSWDELVFLPGALRSLARLAASPCAVVIVSNQSAVGRGHLSRAGLVEIHWRMVEAIHAHGGRVDAACYCPHRPSDRCECRKPRPGLLSCVAQELGIDLGRSFFVGDARTDVEAALEAGCQPVLVLTGRGCSQRATMPDDLLARCHVAADLGAATDWILCHPGPGLDCA